jgi:hypothetical protein
MQIQSPTNTRCSLAACCVGAFVVLFCLASGALAGELASCQPGESCAYLPITQGGGYMPPTATIAPTATPELPPPTFTECGDTPNPATAPDWPVRIVSIDKDAETVTLQNRSSSALGMDAWIMCSIRGGQEHQGISGVLAPGEIRVFQHIGGNIWRDDLRDDGALYTPDGRLASYFADV